MRSPSVRLFAPEAIAAHAVVAPVLGSIMAAVNHARLGNTAALWRTVGLFTMPSAIVLAAELAALLGTTARVAALSRLAGLAWAIAIARWLYLEHRPLFRSHVAAGGRAARWYLATLAGIGVVVLLLAAVFAAELL